MYVCNSSAESFYKQALEVFENSCGENSREVLKVKLLMSLLIVAYSSFSLILKVLSSLSVLYEEMKR